MLTKMQLKIKYQFFNLKRNKMEKTNKKTIVINLLNENKSVKEINELTKISKTYIKYIIKNLRTIK